ncbi:hypothetical protein [Arthrobacter sp. GAS37]|uniref:hypothetical protein n=1 Tax=Arthrobacter sp. GAS37 TaxID=3156261 RepID=UPI00384A7D9A
MEDWDQLDGQAFFAQLTEDGGGNPFGSAAYRAERGRRFGMRIAADGGGGKMLAHRLSREL